MATEKKPTRAKPPIKVKDLKPKKSPKGGSVAGTGGSGAGVRLS
jgi:hypothetical protein